MIGNSPGCGVTASSTDSYGSGFNSAKGGVYATLIDKQFIRVWHWSRSLIPADIKSGNPRPELWGEPLADLSKWNGGCDVEKTFHNMTIVSKALRMVTGSS